MSVLMKRRLVGHLERRLGVRGTEQRKEAAATGRPEGTGMKAGDTVKGGGYIHYGMPGLNEKKRKVECSDVKDELGRVCGSVCSGIVPGKWIAYLPYGCRLGNMQKANKAFQSLEAARAWLIRKYALLAALERP